MSGLKSRRQQFREAMENTAKVGFEHGFVEGGRYVLSLLMGLPRPSQVMLDSNLEPGEVQLRYGPLSEIQMERAQKLDDLLGAIKETDIRTAASKDQKVHPARRLEDIVAFCQRTGGATRQSQKVKDLMDQIVDLARGV